MDNRTALQSHRMPPLPTSTSSSSSRISSSQSYFDVYPERRGNRPYTPSQRLTSTSLKSLPNSEDEIGSIGSTSISRRQHSPQRSPLKSCNRQEALREDAISCSTSNSWLTVSSGSTDLTPSSSSSSLYSPCATKGGGKRESRGKANYRAPMSSTSTAQWFTLSQRPSTSSKKSRALDKPQLSHASASQAYETFHDERKGQKSSRNDKVSMPLRLKSQKSMPNVKERKYQQAETPSFSWLGSVGKKSAKNDKTIPSRGTTTMLTSAQGSVDVNEDSDNSDSSLDSVGKEARSTLRLSMKAAQSVSQPFKARYLTRSTDEPLMRISTCQETRIADRYDNKGDYLHRQRTKINSRTPSPSALSLKTQDSQERQIHRFLRSRRLNTLMTLTQAPYKDRVISFADVGDHNGHPVFLFLGLGAVRYLAGLYDEMATVLHLRIICIDRWGQGRTDDISADQCGVLEWSGVVTEVADRLGIRNFSLLAHSAGAPYAMATSLMCSSRIAGPVHLLAPWVSPTIESGYKWLKYVPDGVIKTAQAADSRMQAWKLGLGKPLTASSLSYSDSDEPFEEKGILESSALSDPSHPCNPPSSSNLPPLYRAFSQASLHSASNKPQKPANGSTSTLADSSSRPLPASRDSRAPKMGLTPSATTPSGLYRSLDSNDSPLLCKTLLQVDNESRRSSLEKPLEQSILNKSPGQIEATSLANIQTAPDLATALLKASHAENLARGGSNDLLVILGRSSQKPWGFNYTDISHPVAVWYGDKDERINMTSILWMQRELNNCSIKIVTGASHDLMTNAAVVVEALESIATQRSK